MHPAIAPHLDEIRELCRRHQVRSLSLFGSAASGDFDPARSDVDFMVEFEPGVTGGLRHPYFALHAALESLLGRRVDLVMRSAPNNRYFLEAVEQTRVPVYAAA